MKINPVIDLKMTQYKVVLESSVKNLKVKKRILVINQEKKERKGGWKSMQNLPNPFTNSGLMFT